MFGPPIVKENFYVEPFKNKFSQSLLKSKNSEYAQRDNTDSFTGVCMCLCEGGGIWMCM